jgi:hypothetical protein
VLKSQRCGVEGLSCWESIANKLPVGVQALLLGVRP